MLHQIYENDRFMSIINSKLNFCSIFFFGESLAISLNFGAQHFRMNDLPSVWFVLLHGQKLTKKTMECHVCHMKVGDRSFLQQHMKIHFFPRSGILRRCLACNTQDFQSMYSLQQHQRTPMHLERIANNETATGHNIEDANSDPSPPTSSQQLHRSNEPNREVNFESESPHHFGINISRSPSHAPDQSVEIDWDHGEADDFVWGGSQHSEEELPRTSLNDYKKELYSKVYSEFDQIFSVVAMDQSELTQKAEQAFSQEERLSNGIFKIFSKHTVSKTVCNDVTKLLFKEGVIKSRDWDEIVQRNIQSEGAAVNQGLVAHSLTVSGEQYELRKIESWKEWIKKMLLDPSVGPYLEFSPKEENFESERVWGPCYVSGRRFQKVTEAMKTTSSSDDDVPIVISFSDDGTAMGSLQNQAVHAMYAEISNIIFFVVCCKSFSERINLNKNTH